MSSNNSYTQAVFLFSHYTFSLFLFNLILPVLLLLYIFILPFSHPFSRASPSYIIFFPCRWPLKSLLIFCWLFPALSYLPTSQIRVYHPTTKLLPVLLVKNISYLKKTTDLDLKVQGYLDYFLELMFQQVDLVANPSVRESFEFSTKCTWLCMQSYFIFIKS